MMVLNPAFLKQICEKKDRDYSSVSGCNVALIFIIASWYIFDKKEDTGVTFWTAGFFNAHYWVKCHV